MDTRRSQVSMSILNLFGFLGTVVVNALAVTLPLNYKTTQQLSDQYPNLFVPAGLTFSIWGIIYILLAILVIYQLIVTFRKDESGLNPFKKIGYLFFVSSILNIGWIFSWHYEIVSLSLLIMLLLLGCLLAIYLKLGLGEKGSTKKENCQRDEAAGCGQPSEDPLPSLIILRFFTKIYTVRPFYT